MRKLKGLLSADWALCQAHMRKESHPLFQDGFRTDSICDQKLITLWENPDCNHQPRK